MYWFNKGFLHFETIQSAWTWIFVPFWHISFLLCSYFSLPWAPVVSGTPAALLLSFFFPSSYRYEDGPHYRSSLIIVIKWHYFCLLSLCLIGGLWAVQKLSTMRIIVGQIFFKTHYFYTNVYIFIIVGTMASIFALQLFRTRKAAVSISLDSPSMMRMVESLWTAHSPPMRHKLSRQK